MGDIIMKCRQAEQWLLLKDSGELPFRKRFRLEQHLAACAHCRAYRDGLERVMSAARQSLVTAEPDVRTIAAIREAARAGIRVRDISGWEQVRERFITAWRPVLTVAALLLLCLGGWYWLAERSSSSVGPVSAWEHDAVTFEEAPSAGEFDDLTAMLMEDVIVVERGADLVDYQDVSFLDRDLLVLEGLAI